MAVTTAKLDQTDSVDLDIPQKRLTNISDFPMAAFTEIGFSHHMEILRKTSELDERLFYIRECAAGHWSRSMLKARLNEDLYKHKGALASNFSVTLPDDTQYMKAIRMFKDEYFLDFINTEELDLTDPGDLDERVYLAHAQLSLPLPELNAVYVSVCDNCGAFHESPLQEL